jgi:hypothetical protein
MQSLFNMKTTILLFASIIAFTSITLSQSTQTYNICQQSSINLNQDSLGAFVSATSISGVTNDSNHGPFEIGFNFCFFGNTYSQFYVSANSLIGFSNFQTNNSITDSLPSITTTIPKNVICAPWQDLSPTASNTIRYYALGIAPNRKLVVTFNNAPANGCPAILNTYQVVLNEGSNIIETNILNKSICTSVNNGNAVHGLHNIDGTIAYVVPSRNNTSFEVQNESTFFTPVNSTNDCSSFLSYTISHPQFNFYGFSLADSIQWFLAPDLVNPISNNYSLTVSPISSSLYISKKYYNNCILQKNHQVNVSVFSINSQVSNFNCNGDSLGQILVNVTNLPNALIALKDSLGQIIESFNFTDTALFYPPSVGIYNLQVSDPSIVNCSVISTVQVNSLITPITLGLSSNSSISCLGTDTANIQILTSGGQGNLIISSLPQTNVFNSYAQTTDYGTYVFTATDDAGCSVSQSITIDSYNAIYDAELTVFPLIGNQLGGLEIVSVIGGSGSYTFSFNNSAFTQDTLYENLSAGTYLLQIVDNIGCEYTQEVEVPLLNIPISYNVVQSCPGNQRTLSVAQANNCSMSGTTLPGLADDNYIGPFSIGFNFCFFGNTYSNLYIGSNGYISFTGGQTAFWQTYIIPASTLNAPKNSIFAFWHDLNPLAGGTVKKELVGTAPNRKMIINWCQVPQYSCANLTSTAQLVLHEGTNIIDIFTFNKPICSTWNSGNAVQGIQNIDNTVAITISGRNNTPWVASNDGKRFTPNDCISNTGYVRSTIPFTPYLIQSYKWFQLPNTTNIISTQSSVSVSPTQNTIYRCIITVGGYTTVRDISVNVSNPPINISTTNFNCNSDTIGQITSSIFGNPPFNYYWTNQLGDTLFEDLNINGPSTFYPPNVGQYTVAINSSNNCSNSNIANISSLYPPIEIDSVHINPTACIQNSNGSIELFVNGGNENYVFSSFGFQENNTGIFNFESSGNYFISIVDTNNCQQTESYFLPAIDGPQDVNYSVVNENCDSLSSILISNVMGGTSPYEYFLDGQSYQSTNNPENLLSGFHNLLVSDSLGCTFNSQITIPTISNPLPAIIQQIGNSLVVPLSSLTTYEWFEDGDTITVLSTSNLFIPNSFGSYFVVVTNEYGCHATSVSYNYFPVGNKLYKQIKDFAVYPNPSNGKFTIESESIGKFSVLDLSGRIIYRDYYLNAKKVELDMNLKSGVYFIQFHFKDDIVKIKKLIIN